MATWSRWGRSSYERDADLAAEAAALADLITVVGPDADAEIISTPSKLKVDAAFLDRVPSARLVVTTTSGYDHFDLEEMRRRGVVGARLPLARRDAVVESALLLLLAGARRLGPLSAAAREGRWMRGELPGLGLSTLRGARVGVVGLGVIGQRMATVLQVLGAEVWGVDPAGLPDGVRPATVEEIFAACDAVTLHCDLNAASRGFVSAALLATAKPGLHLVNTARGKLMDVDAAVGALDAGRLGSLGVDVFPEEPWPRLAAQQTRDNLFFTPHAAGWHSGLSAALREGLRHAVAAWVRGAPVPWQVGSQGR